MAHYYSACVYFYLRRSITTVVTIISTDCLANYSIVFAPVTLEREKSRLVLRTSIKRGYM